MELLINLINYIPDIFQYIFAFAILITVVVFVHEMGHYLVGKWCGIGVETFSIGMGKQIWGRYDKSGTLWRVALFPVGGYVKFKGDEDLSGKRDKSISIKQSDNFHSKSVWQKVATTAAGPVFNFILAIIIFASIFVYKGETVIEPLVGEVLENSAAYKSGVKKGDLITNINGPKSIIYTCTAGYIDSTHWTQDPIKGGGRLIGEACHFVDLIRFLAGSEIVDCKIISSKTSNSFSDNFSLQLQFSDGSLGTIHYFSNGNKSFPKERLEVFASGSIFQIDNFRRLNTWGSKLIKNNLNLRQDKGQINCVKAFIRSLDQNKVSPIPYAEILEVHKILLGDI